jgi:polysaccharide biosynthesis/export protein
VLDSAQMRMMKNHGRVRNCARLLCVAAVCVVPSLAQVQPPNAGTAAGSVFPGVESGAPKPIAMVSAGDSTVRLGIGDLIEVSVYDVPELNTRTRVGATGDLYLPLIDEVHVDGLTVEEAARVIEKRLELGGFVRNPHVQLYVSEYTSDGASVLGEVLRPGVYPVLGEQKLFNVISAAGGLSDRAGKSMTVTHRAEPDKPVTVALSRNLEDHPESNISVFAGDTIMVRRADVIYVVGEVGHPSGFLMDNSGRLSVLQAIALAGGTTSNAKLSGTRIIRKSTAGLSEIAVPLKKLLQAKATDVPLEADDILFVPTSARKIISGRTAEAALQMATAVSVVAIRP